MKRVHKANLKTLEFSYRPYTISAKVNMGPFFIAFGVLLRLSINSALTWNDLDSRKWEIRKEYIDLIYPVLMISNGFMTGTMKPLSKKTYNILLIGHGGGIISSFFSTLDYVKVGDFIYSLY